MTAARRCPQIAPDHPSPHVPPDHPTARNLRGAPPLQEPGGADEATTQGSRSADTAAALGERKRAVYDPDARAFYDAETSGLLADVAAWERASDEERERARSRLAAVRHAEDLIAGGVKRREADAAAAAEAGTSARAVGRWRRKASRLPEGTASPRCSPASRPAGPPRWTPRWPRRWNPWLLLGVENWGITKKG